MHSIRNLLRGRCVKQIFADFQYVKYRMGLCKYWAAQAHEIDRMYISKKSKKTLNSIMKDVISCTYLYQIAPEEYFYFGFQKLNKLGRAMYIGKNERRKIHRKMNPNEERELFNNKWNAYVRFKEMYGREIIKVECVDDWGVFDEFTNRHEQYMVKAISKYGGDGIFLVDMRRETRSKEDIFSGIIDLGACVVEELVLQSETLSRFHPESVNTVRVLTFLNKDMVHIVFAGLRMGVNGNVVDNALMGGLMAGIDIDSGIIFTPGYRRTGESYVIHPSSGQQIIGEEIPYWNDLKNKVKILAKEVPTLRLIGWDLALTNNGWIVIEGNCDPHYIGVQMWEKRGLRERFSELEII